jgi:hypothetical protein
LVQASMVCGGCKEPCTLEDSKPRSSRSQTRFHITCSSNYKYHPKQWSKEPSLKRAWQDKTEEEKAAWLKARLALASGQRGAKREFEVEQTELDMRSQTLKSSAEVMYEPFSEFEDRHLLRGMSSKAIEEKWKAMLNDHSIPRKKFKGQYLLGRFLGNPL